MTHRKKQMDKPTKQTYVFAYTVLFFLQFVLIEFSECSIVCDIYIYIYIYIYNAHILLKLA